MKKTIFRSFVVGLFAVVSLNASAYVNTSYIRYCIQDPGPNYFRLHEFFSCNWMDANSYELFEVDMYNDPNDNADHSGELIRIVWGPDFASNFEPDDQVFVFGREDYWYDMTFQGTHAEFQTVVELDYYGKFYIVVWSGSTAGYRCFNYPVYYYRKMFENNDSVYDGCVPNWRVAWGWESWTTPYMWF
jgi:hypothetical protein